MRPLRTSKSSVIFRNSSEEIVGRLLRRAALMIPLVLEKFSHVMMFRADTASSMRPMTSRSSVDDSADPRAAARKPSEKLRRFLFHRKLVAPSVAC